MEKNLESLIASATARLHAVENQGERDLAERSRNSVTRQAAAYRKGVANALGRDVMDCLQPTTYSRDSERNQMSFSLDGIHYVLRQAGGTTVDVLEGSRELFQFDLASPIARDQFLTAFGEALSI